MTPPSAAPSLEEMQWLGIGAWGALESERLGDWVLRAAAGFTQRGNSAVPLGSPGVALEDAVARVEDWYARRALPPRFVLAGEPGFDPAGLELGALLVERGYRAQSPTLTMLAPTATIAAPGGASVTITETLEDDWLAAYGRTRATVPDVTARVLTGSSRQLFASVTDTAGTPIALARLAIADGWAGLGAVWTDPEHRGRGLATRLTAALADRARTGGIDRMHLQVEQDNAVAIRLYERMGLEWHSAYVYLAPADR